MMGSPRRDSDRPALARRLTSAREGSAAVEFAMLALPFFIVLLAILEIGMILVLDAAVETSVASTGRLVRTGQAQQQAITPQDMKRRFCAEMVLVSSECELRSYMDVRVVNNFTNPLDAGDPMYSGTLNPAKVVFQPGGPGDLIMVRIWYEHQVVTPFLQQALAKGTDGKVLLTTTTAFRNEPY